MSTHQRYLPAGWGDLTDIPDLSEGACTSGQAQAVHFRAQGWDGDSRHVPAQTIRRAKAHCRVDCPIRIKCLEWALEKRIPDGIYGGLDENERRNPMLVAAELAS